MVNPSIPSIPSRRNGNPGRPEAQKRIVLSMAAERDLSGKAVYKITEISRRVGIPYETCRLWIAVERKKQALASLAGGPDQGADRQAQDTESRGSRIRQGQERK